MKFNLTDRETGRVVGTVALDERNEGAKETMWKC